MDSCADTSACVLDSTDTPHMQLFADPHLNVASGHLETVDDRR